MTAIQPVVSPATPIARDQQFLKPEAADSGSRPFDDVMRTESREQADKVQEQKADEAAEVEERAPSEESVPEESLSSEAQDGESQNEPASDPSDVATSLEEDDLGARVHVVLNGQNPVVPDLVPVTQPELASLPHGGILALQKEVKPLAEGQSLPLRGLAFQGIQGEMVSQPKPSLETMASSASLQVTNSKKLSLSTEHVSQELKAAHTIPEGPLKGVKLEALVGKGQTAEGRGLSLVAPTVVTQSLIAPADPVQGADRARMLEAILRAGGGELRQLSGKVLRLKLNPPELGRMQIRAEQRGNELIMQFEVERVEALRVFQEMLPGLELSLAQASGETVQLELRQTDEFGLLEEQVSEEHLDQSWDEPTPSEENDEREEEGGPEILRDGSTVQVTA